MNVTLRSVCGIIVAVAATLGIGRSPANATVYQVDAFAESFFTSGPVPHATGSFSFQFDDSFLMGATSGAAKGWPVLQFQTSLNPIGTTTFSPSNVRGFTYYSAPNNLFGVYATGPGTEDDTGVTYNHDDF